jgi:hypothetical protein
MQRHGLTAKVFHPLSLIPLFSSQTSLLNIRIMASLPNFRIVDTYKAYKLRERKFTSWLLETSEKLGRKIGNKKTTHQGDTQHCGAHRCARSMHA